MRAKIRIFSLVHAGKTAEDTFGGVGLCF